MNGMKQWSYQVGLVVVQLEKGIVDVDYMMRQNHAECTQQTATHHPAQQPYQQRWGFFMATRKVSTPGATETTTPDPAPTAETENTTGTVSELVAADATTSDATTDPTPTAEATQALPDDYEEYLAWKNSRTEQAKEPVIAVTATASTVESEHVLTDKGWTKRGS